MFCRIFEFRKIIGDREKCKSLVPEDYPVYISKVFHLLTLYFSSIHSNCYFYSHSNCMFVCLLVSRQRSTPTVISMMGSSSLLWSTGFREFCHQRLSKPGRQKTYYISTQVFTLLCLPCWLQPVAVGIMFSGCPCDISRMTWGDFFKFGTNIHLDFGGQMSRSLWPWHFTKTFALLGYYLCSAIMKSYHIWHNHYLGVKYDLIIFWWSKAKVTVASHSMFMIFLSMKS